MAAYAAVISLKHTIERLLNSSHISVTSFDQQIIEVAYNEVKYSLQKVLKRSDDSSNNSSEKLNVLDAQIREAVCELEDALDSHVSDQFVSDSVGDRSYPFVFTLDLQKVKSDVDSFIEKVKTMKEEYVEELGNPSSEEDYAVSSKTDISYGDGDGSQSETIGLSDEFGYIKYLMHHRYAPDDRATISIVGMAGIGKTTLAKKVFEDPSIVKGFPCRVWVIVGPKYQLKDIVQDIISQVYPGNYKFPLMVNELQLAKCLYKVLKGKRYLIVLDDVWDKQLLYNLKKFLLIRESFGSRFLLTTRLQEVAVSGASLVRQLRLLNEDESWDLLREKVFQNGCCPPQLAKAGKKIAKNCDGLPLTIVTVAGILSKAEQTPKYWNEVAADEQHFIFIDAYEKISKVLYPSYKYLPQHLKVYFLYMGVFPQKYMMTSSKLSLLWDAEGFLEPNRYITARDLVDNLLEKLVAKNIVIACEQSSSAEIKTCRLHSTFWYLCNREAEKNKFYHVLRSYVDASREGIKSGLRLSIRKSVLFGIKDVYGSLSSIQSVRSILCTGSYHHYPVPICLTSKFLRVLDALSIRLYQFPVEVVKLMHLRYLAITYNGKLPACISKLWNLECLIVHRHLNIKSSEDSSNLPVEIWEMQELKHLQITGSILPDPCGASLPNLLTLLDVSDRCCTKMVLESTPNLKKLGVRIELAPDAAAVPFNSFDYICHLQGLKSFKCVIVNPEIKSEAVTPLASLPDFPSSLKKLTLSGFGYPWEYMRKIALLPKLEVLKLRSYAFRGPVWRINPQQFPNLKYLLLEDTDLVSFEIDSLEKLERLIIKHCYKLKKFPSKFRSNSTHLELFDCDPSASKKIQSELKDDDVRVDVHSSWEEVKRKI